jgi:hypothetical protein
LIASAHVESFHQNSNITTPIRSACHRLGEAGQKRVLDSSIERHSVVAIPTRSSIDVHCRAGAPVEAGEDLRGISRRWYPDKGFGVGRRGPILARNVGADSEILAIVILDIPDRPSLDEVMQRVATTASPRVSKRRHCVESMKSPTSSTSGPMPPLPPAARPLRGVPVPESPVAGASPGINRGPALRPNGQ